MAYHQQRTHRLRIKTGFYEAEDRSTGQKAKKGTYMDLGTLIQAERDGEKSQRLEIPVIFLSEAIREQLRASGSLRPGDDKVVAYFEKIESAPRPPAAGHAQASSHSAPQEPMGTPAFAGEADDDSIPF